MIKGVLFDMDGLMFDTELLTFKIWNKILTEKGYNYNLDIYKAVVGKRMVEVKEYYKKLYGDSFDYEGIKNQAMDCFWEYTQEKGVPKKPGLVELLEFLKSNNIKTALATSTTEKSAREILKRAGVLSYFDTLVCGDMVIKGKPDPEIFLTAVKMLGLEKDERIGLEDSINGINSLYNGEIRAIMVPDLIEPTEDIKSKAYMICDSLFEVMKRCCE